MTTSATDPTKRIPTALGTDAKLLGPYTLADLAVGLLPGVVVVLATQVLLPPDLRVAGTPVGVLTLPLAGAAVALGAAFVSLTPAYTTSLDWLATLAGYARAERRLGLEAAAAHAQVERVHRELDALERTDGALLGVLRVDPPAMALATDDEWAETADAFADVLSTVVEYPVQLYATTRRFPVEAYLARYEARLDDPDVRANPRLAGLIEAYVDWYAGELDRRRMTIRDHYVVVPVTPGEVRFERESLTRGLARLPVVGVLLSAWRAPGRAETRAAMAGVLDDRLHQLERGLRGLDGVTARRVDATTAARLVAACWTGEEREDDGLGASLRGMPLVGGDR